KRTILAAEGLDTEQMETLTRSGVRYFGSDTTRIFCFPTCRHARRVTAGHMMRFHSEEEAVDAGYPPGQGCRPAPARRGRHKGSAPQTASSAQRAGEREGDVQIRRVELRPEAPYDFALAAGYLRTSPSMVLERVGEDGIYRRAVTLGGQDLLLRLRAAGV